jgi:hypothetical protein
MSNNSSLKCCSNCNIYKTIDQIAKGRNQCKECRNKKISCIHNKQKSRCKECGGSQICEHNKQKSRCKDCGGSHICKHNKRKSRCKECGGKSNCIHNKQKYNCIVCYPKCSCVTCNSIIVSKRSQFYPNCEACFTQLFPNHEKARHYKRKEHYLQDEIRRLEDEYKIDIIYDKIIENACSRRKPDIFIDLLLFTLIVECDENQHKNYDEECENKRTMEIFQDLGDRPVVFIRFNPDGYIDENGDRVKGCFTDLLDTNKKKYYDIDKDEWNSRIEILLDRIIHYIDMSHKGEYPEKEITIERIYYDC